MHHYKHRTKLYEKMKAKGWSEEELAYAHHVWESSHEKKHPFVKFFENIFVWLLFALFVVGNIGIMFVVTPLFVLFPKPGIYAVLMVLGFCFGALFTIILNDMDHMFAAHHHFFLYVLVPYLAIATGVVVFALLGKNVNNIFLVEYDPFVLAIVYGIFFIVPIFISRVILRRLK